MQDTLFYTSYPGTMQLLDTIYDSFFFIDKSLKLVNSGIDHAKHLAAVFPVDPVRE